MELTGNMVTCTEVITTTDIRISHLTPSAGSMCQQTGQNINVKKPVNSKCDHPALKKKNKKKKKKKKKNQCSANHNCSGATFITTTQLTSDKRCFTGTWSHLR
jgi:hypothetical protein